MHLSSKHAEMHSTTLLLPFNWRKIPWHFTKNISPRRRVIIVATCFSGRLNLILATPRKSHCVFMVWGDSPHSHCDHLHAFFHCSNMDIKFAVVIKVFILMGCVWRIKAFALKYYKIKLKRWQMTIKGRRASYTSNFLDRMIWHNEP
jgi:hypothetical protein